MTNDDILKTVFGSVLAGIGVVVGWLFRKVLGTEKNSSHNSYRLETLEKKVKEIDTEQLTKEDVREIIDAALDRRDAQAAERRTEWNKTLVLQVKQAVGEHHALCREEMRAMMKSSDEGKI